MRHIANILVFQDDPNAQDKFVRLTKAYETLKDDNLRKTYDLYGEDGFNESHIKQTYSWNHYQDDFVFENPYVIILERSDYCEYITFSAPVVKYITN